MRCSIAALVLCVLAATHSPAAAPVLLEQVVSRHDPALNVAQARLAIAGTAISIWAAPHSRGGYVLKVSLDGRTLGGGKVGYSLTGARGEQGRRRRHIRGPLRPSHCVLEKGFRSGRTGE